MSTIQSGTLLKQLREKHGYTVEFIARLLSVNKSSVSKWESGEYIKTENLYSLANLYGISFSELYNGKLKTENDDDFLKRNFKISSTDLMQELENENIENIRQFFEKYHLIRKEFFRLLPAWANHSLEQKELNEFNYIKRYFKLRRNFLSQNSFFKCDVYGKEEEVVTAYIDFINHYKGDNFSWELTKLYSFELDQYIPYLSIIDSGNCSLMQYMMSSLPQVLKDYVLTLCIYRHSTPKTLEEIEKSPVIKTVLNSGANFYKEPITISNTWEEESLRSVEGAIKTLQTQSVFNYDFSGTKSVEIVSAWLYISKEEYLDICDIQKTEFLRDLVNLKDSDPLQYFGNILRRDGVTL